MVGYFNFLRRLWPLIVALVVADLAAVFIGRAFHIGLEGIPLFVLTPILLFNPFILPISEMYDPKQAKSCSSYTEEVAAMAEKMGVKPSPVRILSGKVGQERINAFYKDDAIFITECALRELSPKAVLFMIGHEIAHLRRLKDQRERFAAVPFHRLFTTCFVILLMGFFVVLRLALSWWIKGPVTAIAFLLLFFLIARRAKDSFPNRELELYCDRMGAELCGDPSAAYEALDRLTEKETARQAKFAGYPTREERLNQIRAMMEATV